MAQIALPLLAVANLRASTFTMGLLTALEFTPWLLFSIPAGALLDRLPPRPVMIVCDVAAALWYATIPVAAWTRWLSIGQILIVAFLTGTVSVFAETAYQVLLPSIVPADDLASANGTLQAGSNAALLSGPGFGGLMVNAIGAASAIMFDAASFLLSAVCLLRITVPATTATRSRGTSLVRDMRDGIAFVIRDPYLLPLTLWAAVANFGLTGYSALSILFLARVEHLPPAAIGLLLTSGGVGAVTGSVLANRLRRRFGSARAMLLVTFCTAPFMLLIPLTTPGPRLALFAVGAAMSAAGIAVCNVYVAAFRQSYPPPGMRARVTATTWFVLNGTYPPGALLSGLLGTWIGVTGALWAAIGVTVTAGFFLLARGLREVRDLPGPPDAVPPDAVPPGPPGALGTPDQPDTGEGPAANGPGRSG